MPAADGFVPEGLSGGDLDHWLADVERQAISQALAACQGVQAHAAKKLGITERSLWHRIKKLGIQISRIVTSFNPGGKSAAANANRMR